MDVVKCAQGPGFTIALAASAIASTLDITTDLLSKFRWQPMIDVFHSYSNSINSVIIVPICLLWKVKIKRRQKILLGIFLCLSICMIIIAIVRISGARIHHTTNIDVQWQTFWNDIEGTVAVIMVSITAFRSLLGVKALKSREKKEQARYWYRRKLLFRKESKNSSVDSNEDQLPAIPGPTLTGIRTLIRGNRDSETIASRINEADPVSVGDDRMQTEKQIKVTQTISSESETVRFSLVRSSRDLKQARCLS